MRKYIWVLGIMAATCSVVAMAKDPKLDQKSTVTAASATQMSDAEMDKVTAGGEPATPGLGFVTSLQELGPYVTDGSRDGGIDLISDLLT